MSKRDAYIEKMKDQLDELNSRISILLAEEEALSVIERELGQHKDMVSSDDA